MDTIIEERLKTYTFYDGGSVMWKHSKYGTTYCPKPTDIENPYTYVVPSSQGEGDLTIPWPNMLYEDEDEGYDWGPLHSYIEYLVRHGWKCYPVSTNRNPV